ncbi:AAA family ATPase [Empedobacter stercoris]|uniref:AAA family ATPase n=1 Tax=Empedobacter stercoris TaxID=1628248 RepID=UPI001662638F|nr:AAA family ATPase [Empedobacter stercoris]MCA4809614.1 AAA family ATPase [Empedobacter stercoris]QNT13537.1 AAA family ATPase [Empedobacter stercoris]
MKLKYISDYLSIKQFEDIELNDFTVITGVNGAGKSHFLNAINNGNIKIQDIDHENIVMYNYNDFNVVNIDLNQTNKNNETTSELFNKHQFFQNKSNSASQKFYDNRNKILNEFKIDRNYDSIFINDDLINNIENTGILDWSEEDKEYYRNFDVHNPDTTYNNYNRILNFYYSISMYQTHKIDDINNFIEFLKNLAPKLIALNIIRNFDYNKEFKYFDEYKFQEVFEIIKTNREFNFWNEENRNKYPHFITNIISNLKHSTILFDIINPREFVKVIKEIYKEIEKHFISEIDLDTLKLIQNINGDNVLDSISFDSGFFNLYDISLEEKNYQLNIKQNDINKFLKSEGQIVHVYSDEELKKHFGESPIKILNDVLNEFDVNGYEFKNSNLQLDIHNGMQNQNIHIYLYNKNGNFQTQLETLSSGEKTLLALAFSVFKLKKKKIIAKVLLMDELDSALHPSMSQRLVNVLYNYFYKILGIKIIISSHSPSTIAFSPNESLYIIKKGDTNKLIHQVSKDEALKELTIGVPSFSINYENRKQVFVESKYDVEYYSAFYDIFKDYLNKDISLNFIASGDVRKNGAGQGVSSCDVVKDVTQTLRNAGNNSIYGLIDWDTSPSKFNNPHVFTLGFNSRYSIENYILDPLFIGFLLIIEKFENFEYFGITNKKNVFNLYNLSIEECQLIINKIENEFLEKRIINQITSKEYSTISGFKFSLSKELATMQGHELESNYLKIYPKLNKYKGSADNVFKNHVIKKVHEEFVDYIPKDLLDLLKDIQK